MALALNGFQRMWYVILPQAMRVAIPPLGNQYLNLIKNSSLGAGFAYFELTNVTQVTVGNGSPAVPAFFLTLLFYVVLSLVTSAIVNIANRRFKVVER
jgi:general L-amino acid transport system permease protein